MLQSIFLAKPERTMSIASESGSYLQPEYKFKVQHRRRVASLVIVSSVNPAAAVSISTDNKVLLKEKVVVKEEVLKREGDFLEKAWNIVETPVETLESEAQEADLQSSADVSETKLSEKWREVQGSRNWQGLLNHPIDKCLRSEIIRYGEFAQACYDGFDMNTHSKYCGSCKYKKSELLDRAGLPDRGYTVTKYLYATSDPEIPLFFRKSDVKDAWNRDSNWIGYVAVATCEKEIARLGRRDIVVAWRGTVTSLEWLENLKDYLKPAGLDQRHRSNKNSCFLDGVKVETGFLHLYTAKRKMKNSAREQLLWEIHRLVGKYEGEQLSITITGHSLGGALALLSAYDIAESGMDEPRSSVVSNSYDTERGSKTGRMDPIFEKIGIPRPHNEDDDPSNNIPITVFSFAAPRVGNDAFRDRCNALGVKVLRVVNGRDAVPKAPGILFNENCFHFLRKMIDFLPWTYSHVGELLEVSSDNSPMLQPTMNPAWHHNLEAHLHLVDGYQGPGKDFQLVTNRDPALVNKAADFLRGELGIPPCWWQDMHKGLVRDEKSGRWVQPLRGEDADE